MTTAEAWYTDSDGNRAHYTPPILGLDQYAKVSDAVKRAAVLLIVIGAIGYRRAAWLLNPNVAKIQDWEGVWPGLMHQS